MKELFESSYLSIMSEENDRLRKEIERLNKQIEEYQKALDETMSEKMDLESIIKEVRKYVQTMYTYGIKNNSLQRNELLEILDKVGEE